MAKKKKTTRKEGKEALKTKQSLKAVQAAVPVFFRNKVYVSLALFGFAVLLYANTLGHGFALDDDIVIRQNMYTQEGISGISGILGKDTFYGFFKEEGKAALVSGGRYRPFSLVVFAVLHQFFGENPFIFHLFTVLLFGGLVVVLYRTLLRLFGKNKPNDLAFMTAFLATLLFAAHPIHVEVVANIKGCDEIWALLGSLGSLWLVLLAMDKGQFKYVLAAAAVYVVGVFSKENAFLFVALTPLALFFFRTKKISEIVKYSAPLWAVAGIFLAVRTKILGFTASAAPGDMMNNPFRKVDSNGYWVDFSMNEWLGTIGHTLTKYVQLLFAPFTLTHDYYPRHIEIQTLTSPLALMAIVLYVGMIVWAFRTKNKVVSYGIWLYLATLFVVSNLLFPVGTNMGERFMFMPSVGFCLVLAAFSLDFFQKNKKAALNWQVPTYILGGMALIFSVLTIMRNSAWESNEKLFFTDVKTSVNSAKLQHACGGLLVDKAQAETNPQTKQRLLKEGLTHLQKANTIHPTYKDARLNEGNCHYYLEQYDEAIVDYKETIRIDPSFEKAKNNLAVALRDGGKYFGEKKGNLKKALTYLKEAYTYNQTDTETLRLLGVANGVQGNHAEAIKWFGKIVELSPESANALYDLGTAYGAANDMVKAQEYQSKALQLDPDLLQKRMKANN